MTEKLIKFYAAYRDHDVEIRRITEKLQSLLNTYQVLDDTIAERNFASREQTIVKDIQNSLSSRKEIIEELEEECQKCERRAGSGFRATMKSAGGRLKYPFRQTTLHALNNSIDALRDNLAIAVHVLQFKGQLDMKEDIDDLKSLVETIKESQDTSSFFRWLGAVDVSVDLNTTFALRSPGTGDWLIKSDAFGDWLTHRNTFLWLYGFAGCGKSVLCSTAIQHAYRHKRSDPRVGVAFFFFTFRDQSKQDDAPMVRTLLSQLANQNPQVRKDLTRLRSTSHGGTPPTTVLLEHIRQAIRQFDQVYILVDALDESAPYDQRSRPLNAINRMREWQLPELHLLVTSRDDPEIRESLNPAEHERVELKNAGVDADIETFIEGRLKTDPRLLKMPEYHEKIQQRLTTKAHGV